MAKEQKTDKSTSAVLQDKEKRRKEREKLESKRIKKMISFPFVTLAKLCTVFALIMFVVMYYGYQTDLVTAIYFAFLTFAAAYLGIGLIIVVVMLFMSEQKRKEVEEKKKAIEERRKQEITRKEEELARLEQMKQKTTVGDLRKGGVNQNDF